MGNNEEVLLDNYEIEFGNEEIYRIEEYKSKEYTRLYIRKCGERKGYDIYFSNEDQLKGIIIRISIQNKRLLKKMKNIRREIRQ